MFQHLWTVRAYICIFVCACVQFVCWCCDLWRFIISKLQGCFQMPAFTSHPQDLLSTSASSQKYSLLIFYCLLYVIYWCWASLTQYMPSTTKPRSHSQSGVPNTWTRKHDSLKKRTHKKPHGANKTNQWFYSLYVFQLYAIKVSFHSVSTNMEREVMEYSVVNGVLCDIRFFPIVPWQKIYVRCENSSTNSIISFVTSDRNVSHLFVW